MSRSAVAAMMACLLVMTHESSALLPCVPGVSLRSLGGRWGPRALLAAGSGDEDRGDEVFDKLFDERFPQQRDKAAPAPSPPAGGGADVEPSEQEIISKLYSKESIAMAKLEKDLEEVDWDAEWAKVVNGEQDHIQRKKATTPAEQAWKKVRYDTNEAVDNAAKSLSANVGNNLPRVDFDFSVLKDDWRFWAAVIVGLSVLTSVLNMVGTAGGINELQPEKLMV